MQEHNPAQESGGSQRKGWRGKQEDREPERKPGAWRGGSGGRDAPGLGSEFQSDFSAEGLGTDLSSDHWASRESAVQPLFFKRNTSRDLFSGGWANREPRPLAARNRSLTSAVGGEALATGSAPVQRSASGSAAVPEPLQPVVQPAIASSGGPLPHLERIQGAFGSHDISNVQAHIDPESSNLLGAKGYATGDHVVFSGTPDLHTAAHEAAHVVQQRAGVHLSTGVSQVGDPYEQHADAVADRVVSGRSAEDLLSRPPGTGGTDAAVQRAGRDWEPRTRSLLGKNCVTNKYAVILEYANRDWKRTGGRIPPGTEVKVEQVHVRDGAVKAKWDGGESWLYQYAVVPRRRRKRGWEDRTRSLDGKICVTNKYAVILEYVNRDWKRTGGRIPPGTEVKVVQVHARDGAVKVSWEGKGGGGEVWLYQYAVVPGRAGKNPSDVQNNQAGPTSSVGAGGAVAAQEKEKTGGKEPSEKDVTTDEPGVSEEGVTTDEPVVSDEGKGTEGERSDSSKKDVTTDEPGVSDEGKGPVDDEKKDEKKTEEEKDSTEQKREGDAVAAPVGMPSKEKEKEKGLKFSKGEVTNVSTSVDIDLRGPLSAELKFEGALWRKEKSSVRDGSVTDPESEAELEGTVSLTVSWSLSFATIQAKLEGGVKFTFGGELAEESVENLLPVGGEEIANWFLAKKINEDLKPRAQEVRGVITNSQGAIAGELDSLIAKVGNDDEWKDELRERQWYEWGESTMDKVDEHLVAVEEAIDDLFADVELDSAKLKKQLDRDGIVTWLKAAGQAPKVEIAKLVLVELKKSVAERLQSTSDEFGTLVQGAQRPVNRKDVGFEAVGQLSLGMKGSVREYKVGASGALGMKFSDSPGDQDGEKGKESRVWDTSTEMVQTCTLALDTDDVNATLSFERAGDDYEIKLKMVFPGAVPGNLKLTEAFVRRAGEAMGAVRRGDPGASIGALKGFGQDLIKELKKWMKSVNEVTLSMKFTAEKSAEKNRNSSGVSLAEALVQAVWNREDSLKDNLSEYLSEPVAELAAQKIPARMETGQFVEAKFTW